MLKVQVSSELVGMWKWTGSQWVLVQSAEFNGPVPQGNVGFCVFDSIGQFDDFQANYNGYTWTTANRFTLGPGAVGGIVGERSASTNKWYHYDAIGNVMELTNQSGLQYLTYEQDAFGNVLSGTQGGYHLTTKEYDSDTSLYYFWARWYDPLVGRFTQKAALPPDEEHPYSYCKGNPLNELDPPGLFTIDDSCKCDPDLWKELNAPDRASKCEEAAKKLQAQWGPKRDTILECVLDLCSGVKNRVIECESGTTPLCNGKQARPKKGLFRKTRVVLCVGNIQDPLWEVVAWEFARICGYMKY